MLITERVGIFIRQANLAPPGARIVAAVSGGADSLCLLDCLVRLGFPVLVAHLDHRLRRSSWSQAEFVLRTARDRGLPCVVQRVGEPNLRRRPGSVEEAARQARYAFLAECARSWGARRIATGHTAADQAETVLMHFLRGAGVDGLRGILPRSPLGNRFVGEDSEELIVIRPLLESTRAQTEAHCRAAGLRPRLDRSNQDPAYFRNRLRHELLPILEGYNPGIRSVLARTARVMARQAELTDSAAREAEARVVSAAAGGLRLDRKAFLSLSEPVQAALVRRAARRLAPDLRDFGFETVERARVQILDRRRGRRTALAGGIEIVDRGDSVILTRLGNPAVDPGLPQLIQESPQKLDVPGEVELMNGGRLTAMREPVPSAPQAPAERRDLILRAWLDAAALGQPLMVRPPQPGDRMRPLGMDGHRKLGEIFNSSRIPAEARGRWPVVVCGDRVIWLAGLRLAETVRISTASREAVRLELEGTAGGAG